LGRIGNTVEKRIVYKVLIERHEGRRLPGIRRCELVDNVKIDLRVSGEDEAGLMWLTVLNSGRLL